MMHWYTCHQIVPETKTNQFWVRCYSIGSMLTPMSSWLLSCKRHTAMSGPWLLRWEPIGINRTALNTLSGSSDHGLIVQVDALTQQNQDLQQQKVGIPRMLPNISDCQSNCCWYVDLSSLHWTVAVAILRVTQPDKQPRLRSESAWCNSNSD